MNPSPSIRALALCASLCLAATAAQAQMFKDTALETLHVGGKSAEPQRMAAQRLAKQGDDVQAVLALAVTALAGTDAGARQTALARAEACLQRLPEAAPCHYALGTVLGVQALSEGMFKAARSAGTVKTALMSLASLLTVPDRELADDVRQWGAQAAFSLVNEGQAAKALGFFERLTRERPSQAMGPCGLVRVCTEAGAFDEAVKLFESSAGLKGAENLPIDYRKVIALQQGGRHDAARVAFKSFVATGKGQKSSLDDARKRLDQLGG